MDTGFVKICTEKILDNSIEYIEADFSSERFNEELVANLNLPERWQHFGDKRKAEYAATRIVIMDALKKKFDMEVQGLLNRKDRSPIWPEGIRGSYSHCKEKIVLILTKENIHLGIDIEDIGRGENLIDKNKRTISESELQYLKSLGLDERVIQILIFSAKESFYKAAFPIVQEYISFDEVELTSLDGDKFVFERRSEKLKDIFENHQVEGRFEITDQHVITILKIV